MLSIERQQQIFELLSQKKTVTVPQLCSELFASPATIRRDLTQMERAGLIQRTHGGAAALEGNGGEQSVYARENQNRAEKMAIAKLALPYIKDSYTLFLDSSSTVCMLAQLLAERSRKLTVITNGLKCANILSASQGCRVFLPGGELTGRSNSIINGEAVDCIKNYCADLALISCAGFSQQFGATDTTADQALVKRAMLQHAKVKILLCDSSKFEINSLSQIASAQSFDFIITNQPPSSTISAFFENLPGKLVYE